MFHSVKKVIKRSMSQKRKGRLKPFLTFAIRRIDVFKKTMWVLTQFNLVRFLLLAVGLWPYEESKLARLQVIINFTLLMSCIVFQVCHYFSRNSFSLYSVSFRRTWRQYNWHIFKRKILKNKNLLVSSNNMLFT